MAYEIYGYSADQCYSEGLWKLPMWTVEEQSRNGPVLTCTEPVTLQLANPLQRVLIHPVRQANPYFHVMEFIWMMAGDNSSKWVSQFNKGFRQYSEPDGRLHGAYGHRWREHFGLDQIMAAIRELKENPQSRRVVLAMWDPLDDLCADKKDLPCNTHIYLRIVHGALNMTVCNRSNDFFWGMLGSNIVHMTLLQEFLAAAIGVKLGTYRAFTNNLHVYKEMPRFQELMAAKEFHEVYPANTFSVLQSGENPELFMNECWEFIHRPRERYECKWLEEVAMPMYMEYMQRLRKPEERVNWIKEIQAEDWRQACLAWEEWHK